MLSKKDSKLSLMYMALCVPQLIKLEARGGRWSGIVTVYV